MEAMPGTLERLLAEREPFYVRGYPRAENLNVTDAYVTARISKHLRDDAGPAGVFQNNMNNLTHPHHPH